MKKLFLSFVILSLLSTQCFAQFNGKFGTGEFGTGRFGVGPFGSSNSITQRMQSIGGLTFYKYFSSGNISADYAAGVATGTYTCSRSATNPTTYIDANGVIQLVTTSDVPRYSGGYYDATGFHARNDGYLAERASTNLLVNSVFDANAVMSTNDLMQYSGVTRWQYSYGNGGAATNTLSTNTPYSTKSLQTQITNQGINVISVGLRASNTTSLTATTVYTASFWVWADSVVTANVRFVSNTDGTTVNGLNSNFTTVANTWVKFSFPFTAATTELALFKFCLGNIGTPTLRFAGMQVEALAYSTSFVPTTTAALTRNADVLKYENAGNSTANEETILIQFSPNSTFANDGLFRRIHGTDTKQRLISKDISTAKIYGQPNATDNGSVIVNSSTTPTLNTSYVIALAFKHSSPYAQEYLNGTSEATYTAGDWTNPAWGTYFYIGNSASSNQLDGTIKRIAKYSRALTATEIATISTLWAAN